MTDRCKIGMILFVVSEAIFFALLVIAYAFFHTTGGEEGPTAASSLSIVKTGIFSVFLFASSATVALAGAGLRARKASRTTLWLGMTILFGAIFLIGQGAEYVDLFKRNITISRNLFGTTFFTLTGFHGLHVLVGLIMLSVLFGMGLVTQGREPRASAMESISIYWHFVDGVWVVIFGVVYLWAFL